VDAAADGPPRAGVEAGGVTRRGGAPVRARRGADGGRDLDSSTALAVLVAITLVAALARAIGLGSGLWLDEANSLTKVFRLPFGEMLRSYKGENDHPLYSMLAHASMALLGESAWSVRLPAALFGVATVPMLYLLARRIAPRTESLASAAILAVAYHHVWFSQNARGYTAVAFFTVFGLWALLRAVETGRMRDFALYGLGTGLAACIHLTMVFVSIGHALALALFGLTRATPRERAFLPRGAVVAFGTAAAITLAFYLPRISGVLGTFGEQTPWVGVSTPKWAMGELLGGLVGAWGLGSAALGLLAVAGGAGLLIAGFADSFRARPLFALLVLIPPFALYAGSVAVRGVLYPRFFFFAIGPVLVVVVRGLFAVADRIGRILGRPAVGRFVSAAGVVAAVVASLAMLPSNYRYPKQDYAGAARWVTEQAGPSDRIFTVPSSSPFQTLLGLSWKVACEVEPVLASRREATTWLLWTFPHHMAGICPQIAALIERDCPQPRTFRGTVGGGDIRVCRLERLPPAVATP
jgi:uncharacterized membrane protein